MKKIIISIGVLLTIMLIILILSFTKIGFFPEDGYIIMSSKLESSLLNGDGTTVKVYKISKNQNIYKRWNSIYVGENNKKKIYDETPLFSQDKSRIINLFSEGNAVKSNYDKEKLYKNLVLSNGKLYNYHDMKTVDDDNYIFMELDNKIFINSYDVEVNTLLTKKIIPKSSFIYFLKDEIRYYYYKDGKYFYDTIVGVDLNSNIIINENSISYYDFLDKLGVFSQKSNENDKENEQVENNNQNKENTKDEKKEEKSNVEEEYIVPSVKLSDLTSQTYSAYFNLSINDPQDRIKKSVTIEFIKDGKTYYKKSYNDSNNYEVLGLYPNQEYKVIGSYVYNNKNNNLVKVEFFNDTIKTKDIENKTIKFDYKIKSVYSNKLIIDGLKLDIDNKDILSGIFAIGININNREILLDTKSTNDIKNGKSVGLSTGDILKSNTKYDFEFVAYDIAQNKIPISNGKQSYKTSKQVPSFKVSVNKKSYSTADININLINKDDVKLNNVRYVLKSNTSSEAIVDDINLSGDTSIIKLTNLDENNIYTLQIIGDYDLEDGNGVIKNAILKDNIEFATESLKNHPIYYEFIPDNITSNSAEIKLQLNNYYKNDLINQLISDIKVKLSDSEEYITLTEDEINEIRIGNQVNIKFNNLESNKEYKLNVYTKLTEVDKKLNVDSKIKTDSFKTLKKNPVVTFTNLFAANHYFNVDYMLYDKDEALVDGKAYLKVYKMDSNTCVDEYDLGCEIESTVHSELINAKNDKLSSNIELNKIDSGIYKVVVIGKKLSGLLDNNGSNIVIASMQFRTNDDIDGKVELNYLTKKSEGINLFDIKDNGKIKYDVTGTDVSADYKMNLKNNTVEMSVINGKATFKLYMPEYNNKVLRMSYIPLIETNSANGLVNVICTGNNCKSKKLVASNTREFVDVKVSGNYISFEVSVPASTNESIKLVLKDLMITETDSIDYSPYKSNNNYLGSFNIDGIANDSIQYITKVYNYKENNYEDEKEINCIGNDYCNYDYFGFKHNLHYSIDLYAKDIKTERIYKIDELSFTTEKEIRAINNVQDLFNVHTKGSYVVNSDLDISNVSTYISQFSGTIDFNGHKIITDLTKRGVLFDHLGSNGEVKNFILEHKFSKGETIGGACGLIRGNDGIISNFIINIVEENSFPIEAQNKSNALITLYNNGIIENFIINFKKSFNVNYRFAGISAENRNIIRNGYIYGKNIKVVPSATYNSSYTIGLVSWYSAGDIYNIFSTVGIDSDYDFTDTQYDINSIGTIVGQNEKNVSNIYVYNKGNFPLKKDVVVGNYNNTSTKVINSYYILENNTINDTLKKSIRTYKSSLISPEFHKNALNDKNERIFNITNNVVNGYYPHLKLNNSMPRQELIELPTVNSIADDIDFVNIKKSNACYKKYNYYSDKPGYVNECDVFKDNNYLKGLNSNYKDEEINSFINKVENNNYEYIIEVNFNNKELKPINNITIDKIDRIDVLSQYYDIETGYVVAILGLKDIQQYKSIYTLTSINDTNINNRYINLELYKLIATSDNNQENINSYYSALASAGNYALAHDIDFKNYKYSLLSINSVNIDFNNHTFSNLENGTMFKEIRYSTIKNLNIDNYNYNYKIGNNSGGFIYTSVYSTIDNVHINNSNFNINKSFGTIVYRAFESYLKNSSVKNSNITSMDKDKLYRYVGGISGENYTSRISSCFVSNLNINIESNVSFIGGIAAYSADNKTIISNTYSDGSINSFSNKIGGIVGSNRGDVNNSYSKMTLLTSGNNVGGIAGESTSFYVSNNLFLGNIINASGNDDVRAIVGNLDISSSNYLYGNSRVDSKYSGTGETIVDFDTLHSSLFYNKLINFGNSYKIDDSISNGILPKLYFDARNDYLLPGQDDIYINNVSSANINFKLNNYEYNEQTNEVSVNLIIDNYLKYENLSFENMDIVSSGLEYKSSSYHDGILNIVVTPKLYLDYYTIDSINGISINNQKIDIDNIDIILEQKLYKKISSVNDWKKIDGVAQNYILTTDLDFSSYVNDASILNKRINRLECVKDDYCEIKNIQSNLEYSLVNHLLTSISKIHFKNINLTNGYTNNYGIFKTVYGSIDNLSFDDISISGNSFIGIIGIDYSSNISNINMKNINVSGITYSGGLAGMSYNKYLYNVNAKNINVVIKRKSGTTNTYIGGLIGHNTEFGVDSKAYQSNINLSCVNITYSTSDVSNASQYVGGLMGYGRVITNVNITGCDDGTKSVIDAPTGTNVGGYAGYIPGNVLGLNGIGGGEDSAVSERYSSFNISNVSVNGLDVVGGYAGFMGHSTFSIFKVRVNNSTVTGVSNSGGIFGKSLPALVNDLFVDNVNIISSGNNAGGISGTGNLAGNNYIVKDSRVTANNNAGGIVGGIRNGSWGQASTRILVENTNVVAINNNAGGIIGEYCSTQSYNKNGYRYVTISNSSNHKIKSNSRSGGAIGFYDNVNANANYNYLELYAIHILNYNIETENGYAGGLLGAYSRDTNITLNHAIDGVSDAPYANIIYANINSTNYSNDLYPALKDYSSDTGNFLKNYVYKNNKITNGGNTNTVDEINTNHGDDEYNPITGNYLFTYANLTDLKNKDFYKDYYFKIVDINQYFPTSKFASGTNVSLYSPVLIPYPEETNPNSINSTTSTTSNMLNNRFSISNNIKTLEIPDIYVYASDVDKINIDFSDYNQGLKFKINDGDYMDIDKKTYTLYYNYLEDFTITVTDGFNEYKYNYKKEDLINDVFTLDDKYYIIKDGSLITNDNISGNYINVFNGKLLTRDSKVYDLTDKSEYTIPYSNFEETTEKPLYEIKYQDDLIKTYYSYSDVSGSIKNNIEFLSKSNEIYMISAFGIDTNIKSKNFIIDSYNGSKYEVVLKNGKLYNLYDNLIFPDGFINEGIKSISNNIDGNSDLIAVLYDNGNYICFNYKTKEIITSNKDSYEPITNYLGRSLKKSFTYKANVLNNVPNENVESYNATNKLVDKLNENPIVNVVENNSNNIKDSDTTVKNADKNSNNNTLDSSKNDVTKNENKSNVTPDYSISNNDKYNYAVYYNQETSDYEVYELNSFISNENTVSLNDTSTNETSVNDVINSDNTLKKYYYTTKKNNNNNKTWRYIFELIFITIIALIFVLYLYLHNKRLKYYSH